MNIYRCGLAAAAAALVLAGCTSTPMRPAPVLNLEGVQQAGAASSANIVGTYTVQPKDTLYSIAVRHGCDTVELMKANNITDPTTLRIGQTLSLTSARKAPVAAAAAPASFAPIAQSKAPAASAPSLQAETVRVEPPRPEGAAADSQPAAQAEPESGFRSPVKKGRIAKRFNPPSSKGIVISAAEGSAAMAASDGQVVYVGDLRGYGKVVIVRHGDSLVTVYGNNRAVSVATRANVKAGQKLGEVGPSGLLFEVRQAGKPVDPVRFVKVD